jgi:hypothetical protein
MSTEHLAALVANRRPAECALIVWIAEIAMTESKPANTHPLWEDVLSFGLGVLIVFSPMLASQPGTVAVTAVPPLPPEIGTAAGWFGAVQLVTTSIGLLIMFLAIAERMQLFERTEERAREWEEVLEGLLGATLIALPFVFGYSTEGTLRYWHYALGGAILLLAIIELRRDYVGDVARNWGIAGMERYRGLGDVELRQQLDSALAARKAAGEQVSSAKLGLKRADDLLRDAEDQVFRLEGEIAARQGGPQLATASAWPIVGGAMALTMAVSIAAYLKTLM